VKKKALRSSGEEKPSRLTLNRETLKVLDEPFLKNAQGGNAVLPTTSYPTDGES
jgi:hypothetical protein